MSLRGGAGRLAALATVLVVLGGTSPAGAMAPLPTGPARHDRTTSPSPAPRPHEHDHGTPAEPAHDHGSPQAPTGGHDHGATPPDTVSTTTRAVVLSGFGVLNVLVLGSAVLLRRRDRRTRRSRPARWPA